MNRTAFTAALVGALIMISGAGHAQDAKTPDAAPAPAAAAPAPTQPAASPMTEKTGAMHKARTEMKRQRARMKRHSMMRHKGTMHRKTSVYGNKLERNEGLMRKDAM